MFQRRQELKELNLMTLPILIGNIMNDIIEDTTNCIDNWHVYESHQVAVDVYKHYTDSGYVYNSHISHVLELDKDSTPTKVISIITDFWDPDLIEVIKRTTNGLDILFDEICDEVNVYDEESEIIETHSLTKLMKKSVIISLRA